jgi:hypothetical protein
MPEKEPGNSGRSSRPASATPEDYPVTSSHSAYPSGDYSYTLEVVMGMQKTLGGLAEGIRNLTEQSKGHDEELKKVCRDVHAAKVVVGVVGALFVAAATFLGFVVKAYLDYLWRTPVK